mmetsp:Transcript_163922/g.398349  ORF Transcript_163922/g.398349 Transcript_163922/m.398349 type:complete len:171 (-) Transcript_163922:577-1089(-)
MGPAQPCFLAAQHLEPQTAQRAALLTVQRSVQHSAGCHTAVTGEACFARVADEAATFIKHGRSHYMGVTAGRLFTEIQAKLHQQGRGDCQRPCVEPSQKSLGGRHFELFGQPLLVRPTQPTVLATWTKWLGLGALASLVLLLGTVWRLRTRRRRGMRALPTEPCHCRDLC